MKLFRFVFVYVILSFFLQDIPAQIDPELIRRAEEAGVTPRQLEILLQNKPENNRPNDTDSPVRTAVFRDSSADFPLPQPDSLTGPRATEIFGTDFFSMSHFPFIPDYNIPTPKNYTLGTGDEVIVDVWGTSSLNFRNKIDPEGNFHLSGVGPIQLSGYTLDEAARKIESSLLTIVGDVGHGSRVKVTLGEIRSIHIHLVGEVRRPGTYTVPSLATVFNALYLAGGPNEIGSLREIRLIRNNEALAQIDLYETLIHGKTESNHRLEEGDVILVPPYHARAVIDGQVKRAAGYELRPGETLADLLRYCGGFTSDAYRETLTLHRSSARQHEIHTVDEQDFALFALQNGDSLNVERIIDRYVNRLTIRGAVWRPGEYEYGPRSNRLSQLVARAEGLKGDRFADRGQIVRQREDFTTEIIPFSVGALARGETDVDLQPEDNVYIPTLEEMTERRHIIVRGEVNRPDTLDFHHGMTVEDAVIGAGGLKESASLARISVARRIKDSGAERYSGELAETFSFDIRTDLSLSPEQAGFTLQPFDEVYIRRSPVYFAQQGATVSGEILFGGNYSFSRVGERLSELIAKAGGVTPEAYTRGASLIRTMTLDEKARVEAKLAMADADLGRDSVALRSLHLATTYPVGIDLEKALRTPGGSDDIVLRDGDAVYIPKLDNTVKISGSVLYANTVTFEGRRLNDYVSQAGGYTDGARRRPFIVYMNGKIASTRRGFLHRRYPHVEAGCEIIVPERAERGQRFGVLDILNLTSSTTAIAAMLATILK
jgi:protein involved in polysaccharide export with SLBB domain